MKNLELKITGDIEFKGQLKNDLKISKRRSPLKEVLFITLGGISVFVLLFQLIEVIGITGIYSLVAQLAALSGVSFVALDLAKSISNRFYQCKEVAHERLKNLLHQLETNQVHTYLNSLQEATIDTYTLSTSTKTEENVANVVYFLDAKGQIQALREESTINGSECKVDSLRLYEDNEMPALCTNLDKKLRLVPKKYRSQH